MGEITALAASGAYTYTDGLRIADKRGQLMEEGCRRYPGVMTSIYQYNSELVKSYCEQINSKLLSVAAVNSRTQLVLSGGLQEIEVAEKYFEDRGARIKRLNTIGAFHSPAMEEASTALKEFLDGIPLGEPRIPVISNVTAKEYASRHGVTDLLKRLLTQTVQWEGIASYFEDHFVDAVVDAGPGVVMKNILNSNKRKYKAYGLDIAEDRSILYNIVEKQGDFTHHHYCELIRLCLCTAVSTPAMIQPVDTTKTTQLYREISGLQEQATSAFYADSLVKQLTEKMSLLLKCKGYSTDQVHKVMDNVLQEAGYFIIKDGRTAGV
ncbi:Malonyl CoA-acyl carrier protein transacylase [compost metagenome]